jgi:cysteine desulfurase
LNVKIAAFTYMEANASQRGELAVSHALTNSLDQPTEPKIYLDTNASSSVESTVAEVMLPYLQGSFGNPSSGHWASTPAKAAIEEARSQVAALLGCRPLEVVFTSGGSEANNLALKGTFFARMDKGPHIITTRVEHPAVLNTCQFLERLGAKVTYLAVDRTGRVDAEAVRRAVTPHTILISIMHANGEVGTIQPLAEISSIAKAHGIPFHTDAAQSLGKIAVDVHALGVDLLSLAGHKFGAPKGIGALYVREGVDLEPLIHGGGHERGRRAGTESALLAAGLGAASVIARDLGPMVRVLALRDAFWTQLQERFGDRIVLNGHTEHRLPNTLNVSFVGRSGAEVLGRLRGVAATTGSACHTGRVELSPVLEAMGVSTEVGMGTVRFSLGRTTVRADIDEVMRQLVSLFA